MEDAGSDQSKMREILSPSHDHLLQEKPESTNAVNEQPTHSESRIALIAGICAILIYILVAFSLYNQLQHLPGPIYGGDLYSHHGFALNYIANGFWTDPYFANNYAFYPWLGNYFFIALSLVGLKLMTAEIYVGLLTAFLSSLAYYFLGKQLFKKQIWAVATMLVSLMVRGIPDGAPNLLPWMITIPFWFAFWLKAEDSGKLRDKILAGLFMGLTALSHVAYFLAAMSLFVVTILFETLRKKERKIALVSAAKMYLPMLAVGFVISLFFYGPILWVYHAQTKNLLFQYNGPSIENLGVSWALNVVYANLIDKTSLLTLLLSVLAVIGIALGLLSFSRKESRYPLVWFVAGTLTPLHHFITAPLLGRWVLPSHLFGIVLPIILFTVIGIKFISGTIMKYSKNMTQEKISAITLVILLIMFAGITYQRVNEWHANPWVQYGKQLTPHTQSWLVLGDWLQKSTNVNSVVLTNDEVCFAMNAVSGRKCVLVRRTHANYFVDVEQRYADGIVMLYGTNEETTRTLLKNYDVQFVLTDASYNQPILIEAKFANYLSENNVSFARVTSRKDPATPNAALFSMLAINNAMPSKTLQNMLVTAVQPSEFLTLYRVKE